MGGICGILGGVGGGLGGIRPILGGGGQVVRVLEALFHLVYRHNQVPVKAAPAPLHQGGGQGGPEGAGHIGDGNLVFLRVVGAEAKLRNLGLHGLAQAGVYQAEHVIKPQLQPRPGGPVHPLQVADPQAPAPLRLGQGLYFFPGGGQKMLRNRIAVIPPEARQHLLTARKALHIGLAVVDVRKVHPTGPLGVQACDHVPGGAFVLRGRPKVGGFSQEGGAQGLLAGKVEMGDFPLVVKLQGAAVDLHTVQGHVQRGGALQG